MKARSLLSLAVVVVIVIAQSSSAQGQTAVTNKPEPEVGVRWTPGKRADNGVNAASLESIYSTMAQDPHHDLKGIVILRGGQLVSEHYFNGDSVE